MNADQLSEQKRAAMSPLRWERVRRGLTIRDVCVAVGISSTSTLGYWETGHTTPDPAYRALVTEFYGLPESQLFPRAYRGPVYPARRRERIVSPAPRETVYPQPGYANARTLSRLREKLAAGRVAR